MFNSKQTKILIMYGPFTHADGSVCGPLVNIQCKPAVFLITDQYLYLL